MNLKIKYNFTQFAILIKNQIELFFKNYKFISLTIFFVLLSLLFDSLGLFFINSSATPNEKITKINILIATTSLLLVVQTIYMAINCFVTQIKNNVCTTELRYGYKPRNIYTSRIAFIFGFSLFYLLILFLISGIFFLVAKQQTDYHNLYLYRLYVSSFAWYAILIFLTIVIAVIMARFLSEISASILATIIAIFFILVPAVSGYTSNWVFNNYGNYGSNESYLFLLTEDYRKKMYNEIQTDQDAKKIYSEFEDVYETKEVKSLTSDELIVGWMFWNLQENEKNNIINYYNFSNLATNILSNNQITSWDDVQEFSLAGIEKDEPLDKIFEKLLNNKRMEKYKSLINILKKYTINYTILKSLEVLYQPKFTDDFKSEVMSKFSSSDEYLFIRTLNSLFFRLTHTSFDGEWSGGKLNSTFDGAIVLNPVEDAKSRIKRDKISNIFNPLRHFNLMFQSIDYNEPFLSNVLGQKQFFYSNVGNIDFDSTGDWWKMDSSIKLKQSVPIESIYVFYFILGLLLIGLSFLGFNKKIKK